MSEKLAGILSRYRSEIAQEWVKEQLSIGGQRTGLMKESELREQCGEFLDLLARATQQGGSDPAASGFAGVRDMLTRISRTRGEQGFSPSETATFILSLKRPVFGRLRSEMQKDPDGMFSEIWDATQLLDKLGLMTTEAY